MLRCLLLHAGKSTSGEAVRKEVLVEAVDGGRYRVVKAPGLVEGLGAGDIIDFVPPDRFAMVTRGGNVTIWVFRASSLEAFEAELTARFRALEGRLDGQARTLRVYTVPAKAGFAAIEAVLTDVVGRYPGAEWYYGNVYDPVDGVTPLNWW